MRAGQEKYKPAKKRERETGLRQCLQQGNAAGNEIIFHPHTNTTPQSLTLLLTDLLAPRGGCRRARHGKALQSAGKARGEGKEKVHTQATIPSAKQHHRYHQQHNQEKEEGNQGGGGGGTLLDRNVVLHGAHGGQRINHDLTGSQ